MAQSPAATATCPAKLQRNSRENDQMKPPFLADTTACGGRASMEHDEHVSMLVNGASCMLDRRRSLAKILLTVGSIDLAVG